ncbi:MAG: DMT family transporter [Actinobacteria bacterium]|nr:MAG: DMT family transporter [Actinomycetota bacterium]
MLQKVANQVRTFPIIAVFAAVLVWSVGPIITLSIGVSINTTIFYRVIFWPPFLFVIARSRRVPITKHVMKISFWPGIFFGLSTIAGFTAMRVTSVANATIIGNVSTALVLFVAPRFLGERIRLVQMVLAAVSFLGISAIVFGANGAGGATLRGDVYALANAVLWAGYFVACKKVRTDGVGAWAFIFGVSVAQVVVVAPWAIATSTDLSQVTARDIGLIVLMTCFTGTVGHTLMVWAQKFVPASTSSLISLLMPVLSMIGAWLVFEQRINLVQFIGGVVVLASLAGVVRYGTNESIQRDVLTTADPLLNSSL